MKIENVIFDLSEVLLPGIRTVHFLGRESIEENYSAIGVTRDNYSGSVR